MIEGSSICYQYSEWSELITNFSSLMSVRVLYLFFTQTFHSLSIQWIECYTSIQQCVYQLCTVSENGIPDFSRKDHFDMASVNIFIVSIVYFGFTYRKH